MSLQRLLLVVFTAGLVVGISAPASAADTSRATRHVRSITLSPDGSGTLIRITYIGRVQPHVRVIRSREAIDALAITDIDDDGNPDILASARAGGLVMWRNAGHGNFQLATPPARRLLSATGATIGRCHHIEAPIQAGDDRYDAAMPRAPTLALESPVVAYFPSAAPSVPVPVRQRPSGRAPPTRV